MYHTAATSYTYDANGNITREQKPVNAVGEAAAYSRTEYVYDSRNRLTGVTQFDGETATSTTTYTYDGVGNALTMTAGGNTTAYTYDRYGNVLTTTDPLGQVETFTYSDLGKPVSKTDRNDVTTTYTYDGLGRLLSTSADSQTVQQTYTLTGQIASESSPWQQTVYAYDALGRCTTVTETELGAGGETYAKAYTYDLADNRTGFILTRSGATVQNVAYGYDALNRLSTVSENGTLQATYTYDTNGNRASLTYANGAAETYAYNKANWITELENKQGSEVISSFTYTYYASGSQRTETDHTGKVTSYTYDGLNRLIEEAESDGLTVTYTYDAAGNRSQMAVTGADNYTTEYAYDPNNRLLSETKTGNGVSQSTDYTYDGNGNTLTKTGPEGTVTYTYNALNQLTGAATNDGTASYTYNAQGIRTGKQVGETETHFLLDGGNVVAEVQNNTVTASYLRGINLIFRTAGAETTYYLFNAHGDVVNLVNPDGAVIKIYDYDAFGNEKSHDPADPNPFRYCGEYWDAETKTYYLRARYYAPDIGRFTQQDTHWNTANMIYGDTPHKINEREDGLGLTMYTHVPQITAVMQSGNRYVYAINNPMAYVDPSGQIILIDDLAFAAGVVVIAGTAILLTYTLVVVIEELGKSLSDIYSMTSTELRWLIERAEENGSDTPKTVDDILKDAKPGRKTKGKTKQYDKEGDYDDALNDFNSLGLSDVKEKEGGVLVGNLPDGREVNVRNYSTEDSPTLDIYDPATGKHIKIRYK